MKVTRLKNGYRIRLSDAEYGLLEALVTEGEAGDTESMLLTAAQERARLRRGFPFLRIDEDRRND